MKDNEILKPKGYAEYLKIALMMVFCILLGQTVNAQAIVDVRESFYDVKVPEVTNEIVYENDKAVLDASNVSDGYVMLCYNGTNEKVKMCVEAPNGERYSYLVKDYGEYSALPLTCGNGVYTIAVYESISLEDTFYRVAFSQEINVNIENAYSPFLYSNYNVDFSEDSEVVEKARELAENCTNDSEVVSNIYEYIIKNIIYDVYEAETVKSGYVPNPDEVLRTGKGICFDYASLMTAMLRSQNIPTKLCVGYVGDVYHAWISCYVDGEGWTLFDPTLGANNSRWSVEKFIGDGSNYVIKYIY